MIIGGGMMATAFADWAQDHRYIILAGGVSDSAETAIAAFQREETLLRRSIRDNPDKTTVYFSTCSIYDSSLHNSPYVQHKTDMERLIRTEAKRFVIFRLPQVVGHTRSPTIINFLYHKILHSEPFELWANSTRNLIDVADVVNTVGYILTQELFINRLVNLASPRAVSIYEIVLILEQLTEKRAVYHTINKGAPYHIDLSQVKDVYYRLGIKFHGDYTEKVIRRYYAPSD